MTRGRRMRVVEHGVRIRQYDGRYIERGVAGSTTRAHPAGSELLRHYPDAPPGGSAPRYPASELTVTWEPAP